MKVRRLTLCLVPVAMAVLMAAHTFEAMVSPDAAFPPFTDAMTYLAAGERLNAGHDLYRLTASDRPVSVLPDISLAPLLSPPPIAVLWRPIAALPFGFALWIACVWAALLGTVAFLVYRTGVRGALLATILSPAIGEQLAVCNVAAFFPLLLTVAWWWRGTAVSGASVGVMACIKIAPGAMAGWMVGTREWAALAAAAVVVLGAAALTVIGAGLSSIGAYLAVAGSIGPSTLSLSGLTGISWLSSAVLIGGTLLAVALGRWPAWSFIVAVVASVLGTPALYLSGLATLLAVIAPSASRSSVRPEPVLSGELPAGNVQPSLLRPHERA